MRKRSKSPSSLSQLGKMFLFGRVPGQLVIQYTDRCNAQCPQCGMRASNRYPRHTLDPGRGERIIAAAAERGFAALSFTGGEPFLYLDEICRLSRFAGEQGIKYIRTGTNGYLFCGAERADFYDRICRLADQLAATPIRNIWVSLDSVDAEVHEQMRGLPGVVQGIEKALPIFAERGLYLSANLGINRNFAGRPPTRELDYGYFASGFERFYRRVQALGFNIANVCYPMWSGSQEKEESAVYAATSSDQVVYFSRPEKLALIQALFDVIPRHRQNLRIFTPRASLHALYNQHRGQDQLSTPCRGGRISSTSTAVMATATLVAIGARRTSVPLSSSICAAAATRRNADAATGSASAIRRSCLPPCLPCAPSRANCCAAGNGTLGF